MEYIRNIDAGVDNLMSMFLRKPTLVKAIVHLILILYAARVAPKPPQAVLDLFENQYFKLFFFTLILWTAQFSPSTSLLIAISFLITMNFFGEKALWEFMENTENTVPMAPSFNVALETSSAIIETQVENPPMIQEVTQIPETIVIQPTINGDVVETPTVVVAPAVVSNGNGEKLLVKPEVTILEVPSQPESVPEPAPEAVPELAPIESAPPVEEPKVESKVEPEVPEQGCYPIRRYDMSQVSGFSETEFYGVI